MSKYQKICTNIEISGINFKNGTIDIYFKDSDKYNLLIAYADCCSESWFELYNDNPIDQIVGKKIQSLQYVKDIDLPPSGVQERDINHIYRINFTDDTYYDFVLRNSSNGYYDGWLEIHRKKGSQK
ncbi:hypothetical protein QKC54_gp0940 [Megavirus baoshan]|uniref:DUF7448 domain-containing protein n=1 Tax=Megavirus baoshan TaxID=2496520 RepID=A0A3S5HLD0_9VIRU|nr:hypothetical protein QKC54_gp0940 [Megavirus baoshan]AZL89614.1 hypothetical protein Mb0132 [Megavirus baoshan]